MPIVESETVSREELEKIRKRSRCKVCGEWLNTFLGEGGLAFIACHNWLRTAHDGISREASEYEKKGMEALTFNARRRIMENTYGHARTKALTKYAGVLAPSEKDLGEMLTLLFPRAPEQDKKRALLLCLSYKLNPLANHVFLIPFKDTWVLVQSIKAKRLLASRRGSFSYVDNTPRVMTEAEQTQIFGEPQPDRLWAITKLKDTTTGAEAVGYGFYLKKEQPYGVEKGNSQQNMAFIRSESQAIDRLRPSEMPTGIEVMPEEAAESAIEGSYKLLEEETEPEPEVEPEVFSVPDEPEPKTETPVLDENPVTKADVARLTKLLEETGMSAQDLGKYIRDTKGWEGIKTFGDLKKYQFNELIDAFVKGKQ